MSFMPGDNPQEDDQPEDDGQGGQPTPRRYGGGKYASLEEFERGYSESFNEINRVRSEALAAQAEAAAYKRMLEENRVNRGPAADPGPSHIPVDEEGVPRAHVRSLAAEEAARAAREAVAEALRPLMAGVNARTEMLKRNPEYGKHEVEVQSFLASDPYRMQMYQEMAQVNPIAAMEFAFSGWKATHPEPNPSIDSSARVHAGMPNSAPTSRGDEKAEMDQRKYNQLLQKGHDSGDYSEFLEYRLRNVVPQGHLKRPA